MIQLAKEKADLVILIAFPHLAAVSETASITKQVKAFAEKHGIPVLDLAPVAAQWPSAKLVVSNIDSHPSRDFHALVAKLLADKLRLLIK